MSMTDITSNETRARDGITSADSLTIGAQADFTGAGPQADPTLVSAQVTFLTTDDNKEKDSVIEIVIRDLSNNIIARASNNYGEFGEHSTNGPFSLVIFSQAPLSSLKPGGSINLHFTPLNPGVPIFNPNNDEWHFNLFVDLVFSDDSHIATSENGLRMSGGSSQQVFGL
jgi:hypothetical protein